jgi:tRNA pseudouridine55 synthase
LALGTVGHVSQLRRTRVGGFCADSAIGLETLQGFMHSPAAFEHLRPISTALDGIPALAVTGPDAVRLRSGNPILIRATQFARIAEATVSGDDLQGLTVFCSTGEGEPVALTALQAGELRPFRVFNFGTG